MAKYRLHILSWLVFILYEITLLYFLGVLNQPVLSYILSYLLCISLFYFNSHVIFKNTLSGKRRLMLLIPLIVSEIILFMFVSISIRHFIEGQSGTTNIFSVNQKQVASHVGRAIYFIGLSTAYWFGVTAFRRSKKISEIQAERFDLEKARLKLEKDLSVTQLLYLKAQVSPHFVFNTINIVYNMVEPISDKAAETIMTLSKIMRYALETPDSDGLVYIKAEIGNIENLIRMAEIRFRNNCFIDFVVAGDIQSQRIPPMILGTFVENVLKHADIQNANNPARIKLIINENFFYFNTKNRKSKNANIAEHSHTGIEFAKNRLLHYYEDQCTLEVIDEKDQFELTLKLYRI